MKRHEPVPSSVQHRSFVGPGATLQVSHRTRTGPMSHTFGAGLFVFDRLTLSEKWGGMVNLRHDRITNRLTDHLQSEGTDLSGRADFDHVTLRLGLSYSPSETLGLFANWGQGLLPPATEELANNPAAHGGFNEGLQAATSWGEEVGVRGLLGQGFLYDVTAFHLETEGDFDRYRIASRPLETFYRNGGNSRRFGVEAHENWHFFDAIWLEAA